MGRVQSSVILLTFNLGILSINLIFPKLKTWMFLKQRHSKGRGRRDLKSSRSDM